MDGPEHYRAAESALIVASQAAFGSDIERYELARAQVHATLALAAATARSTQSQMFTASPQWREVLDA